MTNQAPRLIVVGASGGTSLGGSLVGAAGQLGIEAELCDVGLAGSSHFAISAMAWRLGGRTMPHARRLRRRLRDVLERGGEQVLITTGLAPIRSEQIRVARDCGAATLHFSSDDPWNPNFRSSWHFEALQAYDCVFTPRQSNVADLRALGCRDVRYLPFGYDSRIFPRVREGSGAGPVLFVGGADSDRARFFTEFRQAGGKAALVGDQWQRFPDLRRDWLGRLEPDAVAQLTREAAVNLILVRRANRDGHTMRSFEAAAIGGCLAVEDTIEHREIFGPDGEAVRYFASPQAAAELCRRLVDDPAERRRMASAVSSRIRKGRNSYKDRLATMLGAGVQCGGTASRGATRNA